jgi:hypothetical protein
MAVKGIIGICLLVLGAIAFTRQVYKAITTKNRTHESI